MMLPPVSSDFFKDRQPPTTAKVFLSGHSQAVRIPKEFRFKSKEVEISRRGNEIVLTEKPESLARAFDLLAGMSPDYFKDGRQQPKLQRRPRL